MKIDTSKLTPVQAQQIQAIASGLSFNLSLHVTRAFTRSPISIRMTATTDTANHYDPLIEHFTGLLANTTDPDEQAITQEHIGMLRRRRAGIPEWECRYEVFSAQYSRLPHDWKKVHGSSLNRLINAALQTEYGLTNLQDNYLIYPTVEVTLDDWASVKRWYDRHLELDRLYGGGWTSGLFSQMAGTVDRVIEEYISALPVKDRPISTYLDIDYDGQPEWRQVRRSWSAIRSSYQTLKAILSKTLDKLRLKA